jgi:hypothetical protein
MRAPLAGLSLMHAPIAAAGGAACAADETIGLERTTNPYCPRERGGSETGTGERIACRHPDGAHSGGACR